MILAAGRRVPKFRLIAPLTASVHLSILRMLFDAQISQLSVSIPTGISICSLPDIIDSVDFSTTNCILLIDGRINSRLAWEDHIMHSVIGHVISRPYFTKLTSVDDKFQ